MNENEKRYVTREEYIRERNFTRLWVVLVTILLTLWGIARADSTKVFQAIEKPKPTVCKKICEICGHCIPKMVWREANDIPLKCALSRWRCGSPCDPFVGPMFIDNTKCEFEMYGGCDSIIWGRYRTICRIDTVWRQVRDTDGVLYRPRIVPIPPSTVRDWVERVDTVFTDDPRCGKPDTSFVVGRSKPFYHDTIPVIPSSGLDSTFNVKEKIWYYFNWSNGKRVNMRLSK